MEAKYYIFVLFVLFCFFFLSSLNKDAESIFYVDFFTLIAFYYG